LIYYHYSVTEGAFSQSSRQLIGDKNIAVILRLLTHYYSCAS